MSRNMVERVTWQRVACVIAMLGVLCTLVWPFYQTAAPDKYDPDPVVQSYEDCQEIVVCKSTNIDGREIVSQYKAVNTTHVWNGRYWTERIAGLDCKSPETVCVDLTPDCDKRRSRIDVCSDGVLDINQLELGPNREFDCTSAEIIEDYQVDAAVALDLWANACYDETLAN